MNNWALNKFKSHYLVVREVFPVPLSVKDARLFDKEWVRLAASATRGIYRH